MLFLSASNSNFGNRRQMQIILNGFPIMQPKLSYDETPDFVEYRAIF